MRLLIGAIASIIVAIGILSVAQAQQPRLDSVYITENDCLVSVHWVDGTDDTEKIEVFTTRGAVATSQVIDLDDVVGDQSQTVLVFTAEEGDKIRAVLSANRGETEFVAYLTVGECPEEEEPTPTPTLSPTATATETPVSTATPAPTATPIIVTNERVIERVVTVEVPVVTQVIQPPSTGDAGLAQ